MKQVKIFCEYTVEKLEEKINDFLEVCEVEGKFKINSIETDIIPSIYKDGSPLRVFYATIVYERT